MWQDKPFALHPVNFFALAWDCPVLPKPGTIPTGKAYTLPTTDVLCNEKNFAKVAIGWHTEGLSFFIEVNSPYKKAVFPQVEQGDSVELFIDTRDLKAAGFNTRFCHHFYFLPEPVEGHEAGEMTRFRTEDRHPYCDAQLLTSQVEKKARGYTMHVFIPAACLHGYDPKQFERLGFTYRINRFGNDSQHWSVVSQEYQIDQQPALWGSIRLLP